MSVASGGNIKFLVQSVFTGLPLSLFPKRSVVQKLRSGLVSVLAFAGVVPSEKKEKGTPDGPRSKYHKSFTARYRTCIVSSDGRIF